MTKVCEGCGIEYTPTSKGKRQKFCTKECAAKNRTQNGGRPRVHFERPCKHCGRLFIPQGAKYQCCSVECRDAEKSNSQRAYDFNTSFFEQTDDPVVAYFAGLMVADGCVYHKPNSTTIDLTLHPKDTNHLRLFADILGIPSTADPIKRSGPCHHLITSSPDLRGGLELWSIIPRKTYELRTIPSLWSEPEVTPHFLRGMWDGDGHIGYHHTNNTINIKLNLVCNSWIIDWAAGVLTSQEIEFIRYDRPSRILEDGTEFMVSKLCVCKHDAILKALTWMGYYDETNIILERKREAAVLIKDWFDRTERRKPISTVRPPRNCEHCGSEFQPHHKSYHRFCSDSCRQKAKWRREHPK